MTTRLETGKVPWDVVARNLRGSLPPEVLLGPGLGEDAALVEIGGEPWAVASDPISFTALNAGRLAVIVNANDVAARGAAPRLFVAVLLLAPATASEDRVGALLSQIQTACAEVGAALIGGHTEVTPGLGHDLVVGTMLGPVTHRPLTSSGLRPGDRVGLTKWAALEGTAILLDELADTVGPSPPAHPDEVFPGWLSVVPEARLAAGVPGVSALHDVTEGGVAEALNELALASGVAIHGDPAAVPLLASTRHLCADLGIDPLGLIGSGALLVGSRPDAGTVLEERLASEGIPFAWIGEAGEGRGCHLPRFPRDEILRALALRPTRAVVFDMDGTLVASHYDWPAIRRQLGVEGRSIIDELNGLDEPQRSDKWQELEAIERLASEGAGLMDGVHELLDLLAARGVKAALVTNNTDANTALLLDRFDLRFDLVLTRDSGLFKPSGAPIAEAMVRLGADPAHTIAIGDSSYDLSAGREAGCCAVVLVNNDDPALRAAADLACPDLPALIRHLRLVLSGA